MSIFDTSAVVKKQKTNRFNLSHENLITANMGPLYPVLGQLLIPGDRISLSPAAVIKSVPTLAPFYANVQCDFHCFAVPLRLMSKNWSDWIYNVESELSIPSSSLAAVLRAQSAHGNEKALYSYFGLPSVGSINGNSFSRGVDTDRRVNVWKPLAYHYIWKEYFRDEDLQELDDNTGAIFDNSVVDFDTILDGDDSEDGVQAFFSTLHYRCWRKDYFTSARPWPQKGLVPTLSISALEDAPVTFHFDQLADYPQSGRFNFAGVNRNASDNNRIDTETLSIYGALADNALSGSHQAVVSADGKMTATADMESVSVGVTIADLRNLFAVQRWLEINAVAGSRYIEGTLAYYGVRVKDSRAQVPEFIGMSSTTILMSEIVQHEPTANKPQGNRTGLMNASAVSRPFRYFATEHCVLMCIMSLRPKAAYFQGLNRDWFRLDQFDYCFPLFQHLGEQPVYNYELCCPGTIDDDDFVFNDEFLDGVFGYQSRYAEFRSAFDEINGEFRSSLDYWHISRVFGNQPQLNDEFVQVNSVRDGLNRSFAVITDDVDHFYCDIWFNFQAWRPLKYHTTPALVG